ncbi:DUF2975 domain-containing protein [Pseudozobellia sp. WGM2]|uniref:DUF2975 domain-containing protein n=1 Tax=Pseudozobellia sp. WGM2 TaxID=2787625 RepID=UPI001AE05E02|nr:DUF2975 domain-containing protein [Pseudozobellia sp. WGM2]
MEGETKVHGGPLIGYLLTIFRIIFFLFAISILFWALYSFFVFATDAPALHMEFPVLFSIENSLKWQIPQNFEPSNLYLHNSIGSISADFLPKRFLAIYSLISLAANLCALLSIKYVIRILEAVRSGNFLIVDNANRLRKIAIIAIALFLIDKLAITYSAYYFSDKLEFNDLNFTSINMFSFQHLESVFGALFLLIIAEAFRIGAQLKKENDLTI